MANRLAEGDFVCAEQWQLCETSSERNTCRHAHARDDEVAFCGGWKCACQRQVCLMRACVCACVCCLCVMFPSICSYFLLQVPVMFSHCDPAVVHCASQEQDSFCVCARVRARVAANVTIWARRLHVHAHTSSIPGSTGSQKPH